LLSNNPMKKLRAVHLYLGCIFAPMLIFFAVSGLWQTVPIGITQHSRIFALLSSIHTSHGMKIGSLTSIYMMGFVVLMALSLILNVLLGIVMAFKFGHKRAALYSLAGGIIVPLILVLMALHR
jgi:hypothetical protein